MKDNQIDVDTTTFAISSTAESRLFKVFWTLIISDNRNSINGYQIKIHKILKN